MSTETLSPTSYALLGLLALRPSTTYELAQQMDRTLSRFWPRARSKVYEEPKKLVRLGLATASDDAVGRRRRTVYAITADGRRALADWLAAPGEGPVLEWEQLLQVFFADQGSTADVRRTIEALRAWVHERTLVNVDVGRAYLEGRGPFPERAAVVVLVGRFLDEFLETLDRWATWADELVAEWPDDASQARPDWTELDATVQRALERATRGRSDRW